MITSILKNKNKWLALFFWLGLWQVLSMTIQMEILLVSPFKVLVKTLENMQDPKFYIQIFSTGVKVLLGFFLGTLTGFIGSFCAYFFSWVEQILSPFVRFLKTVPLISFIILLLFFAPAKYLCTVISTIMVFPMVYIHVENGLKNLDGKILEMAEIFQFTFRQKFHYIYMDGIKGYLRSAMELSIGMAWKSGLAGEVLGLPPFGIGTELYNSKIYLDMPNLLSYTFVAIFIARGMERGLSALLRRIP